MYMKKMLLALGLGLAVLLAGCASHDNGSGGANNPYNNTGEATNHGMGMSQ